jgi:hypothetical protein
MRGAFKQKKKVNRKKQAGFYYDSSLIEERSLKKSERISISSLA